SSPACRCGRRTRDGAATPRCTLPDPLNTAEEHARYTHADLRSLDQIELLAEEALALSALGVCRDERARRWWRERFTRARALCVARRSRLRTVPVAGRGRR